MNDRRSHWEQVFADKTSERPSWHQKTPEASLELIEAASLESDARILDVGAGTSRLVDSLLDEGFTGLGVLDISAGAIERVRARLGPRADLVEWFVADATEFVSPHPWDLWHDRAFFHFLVDPSDRARYREALLGAISRGGQAIISTFDLTGPPQCSGLDVARYDAESLTAELGPAFELLETRSEDHLTPRGLEQPFTYARFRVLGNRE